LFVSRSKTFPAHSLNVVSKNIILTATHQTKTSTQQFTAKWNSSKHCAACSLAK